MANRSNWKSRQKPLSFMTSVGHRRETLQARLSTEGESVCDSIRLREEYEIDYLDQEVTHWMKRAKNHGSDEYKTRYERIGTYALPSKLDKAMAGSPWKVEAKPNELSITKKLRWKATEKRVYQRKPWLRS